MLPLRLRPRRPDFRWGVELLEVLGEAVAQVFGGFVVGGFIGPGIPGVKHLRWHAVATFRNAESERRLDFKFFLDQVALDRKSTRLNSSHRP